MKTIKITSFLVMLLCANSLMAQLKVIIKTGGDDLRGGQGAYVQLIYKNGTVSPEFDLNGGVNWGNNSENTKSFSITSSVRPEAIASVRIRHDGTPHRPFETYDNWNVDYLFVSLNGSQITQCSGTPWHRFTGESKIKDCQVAIAINRNIGLDGCWETKWTNCGPALGGAKLTFKKDLLNNSQYTGAWGGGVDSKGYSHSGFMTGKLNGNTLYGTWYEVIYKDNATCPIVSYQGKFQFKFDGDKFDGTWTDINGPSKDCNKVMTWFGNRYL